jgi:ribose/xylose/arabinose/galactoside ABC-type transport system permease subunit
MLLSHRYLFFLILTIIFATVKSDSFSSSGRVAAVVVCLIFQILALAWYVLSYIPFGRDMVKKCFGC